jgi:hypothetical protein
MSTPRIGPIEGGEDYLGLSPPFIPPTSQYVPISCSAAISGTIVVTTGPKNLTPDGWPTVSITPLAGVPAVILGLVVTTNRNFPTDTNLVPGTGWTLLNQGNSISNHPLGGIIYKAISSASGTYNPNATYTVGFGSGPATGNWAMMTISMQLSVSSPIQHAFNSNGAGNPSPSAVLGSVPNAGNVLVLVAWQRDGTIPSGPIGTGWTALGTTYAPNNNDTIYAWTRCVVPGDGTSYGIQVSSGETMISISEWTP